MKKTKKQILDEYIDNKIKKVLAEYEFNYSMDDIGVTKQEFNIAEKKLEQLGYLDKIKKITDDIIKNYHKDMPFDNIVRLIKNIIGEIDSYEKLKATNNAFDYMRYEFSNNKINVHK